MPWQSSTWFAIKEVGTKKVEARNQKGSTKYVHSYKFSIPKMPKRIQNSFLKRAQMPHFYNTGFQKIQFWDGFS